MEWNEKRIRYKISRAVLDGLNEEQEGAWEHDGTSPSRRSVKVGRFRAMPEIMRNAITQSLLATKTHTKKSSIALI